MSYKTLFHLLEDFWKISEDFLCIFKDLTIHFVFHLFIKKGTLVT